MKLTQISKKEGVERVVLIEDVLPEEVLSG